MADDQDDPNTESSAGAGISRRRFIEGIIAASAVTSIATVPTAQAEGRTPIAIAPALTGDERAALTVVLDRLIPPDGRMPGAGQLGIGAFIEKASSASTHIRRHVEAVLASLPGSVELSHLDGRALDTQLQLIERLMPEAFDLLLQATYTGYYRHPKVLRTLGGVKSDHDVELCFDRFDLDAMKQLPSGAADA